MTWTIEYGQSAQKSARKLDRQTRRRIRDFLEIRLVNAQDPRQLGTLLREAKLQNLWRSRFGAYRLTAEIKDRDSKILIVRIAHRRHVYRR